MPKMSLMREYHYHPSIISSLDHIFVLDRTTRLDDKPNTVLMSKLNTVVEGKECI